MKSSDDPVTVAHLHYLIALLLTKRVYDLEGAMSRYATARDILLELVDRSPQARIEYAWLLNGEALIFAMKARSEENRKTRDEFNEIAFGKALEPFRLVRGMSGMSAFYLRHNLAANLTFLLEITARVAEARSFWERSFAVPSKNEKKAFILPYRARIGMLLHKEGDSDKALESLETALGVARELGDAFYEERVLAAIGYVAANGGHMSRAAAAYADGMAISAHLRDTSAQEIHAVGLLSVAARTRLSMDGAWIRQVHAWPPTVRERLTTALAAGTLAEELAELGLRPQIPSPKLPPYIPGVDLEGSPQRDLNRLLVGADNLPAAAPAGRSKESVR